MTNSGKLADSISRSRCVLGRLVNPGVIRSLDTVFYHQKHLQSKLKTGPQMRYLRLKISLQHASITLRTLYPEILELLMLIFAVFIAVRSIQSEILSSSFG